MKITQILEREVSELGTNPLRQYGNRHLLLSLGVMPGFGLRVGPITIALTRYEDSIYARKQSRLAIEAFGWHFAIRWDPISRHIKDVR